MENPDHRQRTLRDLRARLDAIRCRPAPPPAAMPSLGQPSRTAPSTISPVRQPSTIVYRRDVPLKGSGFRTPLPSGMACRKILTLDEAVEGREVSHPDHGPFYLVTTSVAGQPGLPDLRKPFQDLAHTGPGLSRFIGDTAMPAGLDPGAFLFLDLETAGLNCSPLFLIGAMVWDGADFEVRQYFARHYAEEPAVIAAFLDLAASRKILVTFNGKTFDWPFLRMRAAANALRMGLDFPHLDLLHLARRCWKNVLPDCRLQTLESRLCGRVRRGDIPGCEIPDAYHAFVRTGHARMMAEVLKHNLMDLVTLAELLLRLAAEPMTHAARASRARKGLAVSSEGTPSNRAGRHER